MLELFPFASYDMAIYLIWKSQLPESTWRASLGDWRPDGEIERSSSHRAAGRHRSPAMAAGFALWVAMEAFRVEDTFEEFLWRCQHKGQLARNVPLWCHGAMLRGGNLWCCLQATLLMMPWLMTGRTAGNVLLWSHGWQEETICIKRFFCDAKWPCCKRHNRLS